MTHVMLDLETFGTAPGSVIRSIGAVVFDLDGNIGNEFYANIDSETCREAGLTVDPKTVAWWAKQSREAQNSLLVNPQSLGFVVADFHGWFITNGDWHTRVWSQGANFDPALWEAAALAVKELVPWKFYNVRDTRTAYEIGKFDDKTIAREGTYHNALDDCKHQVRCVAAAIAKGRMF